MISLAQTVLQNLDDLRCYMKDKEHSMLKIVLYLLLSWFTFFTSSAMACSCMYQGEFKEYATKRDGIIRARINSYGSKLSHGETLYESMIVEVTDVIKGNYSNSSLIFLGDPGYLCRAYVNSEQFTIGSEHLFSIFSSEKDSQPLGGCGESSVVIKGDYVEGYKQTNDGCKSYRLKIADLIKFLQQK